MSDGEIERGLPGLLVDGGGVPGLQTSEAFLLTEEGGSVEATGD